MFAHPAGLSHSKTRRLRRLAKRKKKGFCGDTPHPGSGLQPSALLLSLLEWESPEPDPNWLDRLAEHVPYSIMSQMLRLYSLKSFYVCELATTMEDFSMTNDFASSGTSQTPSLLS